MNIFIQCAQKDLEKNSVNESVINENGIDENLPNENWVNGNLLNEDGIDESLINKNGLDGNLINENGVCVSLINKNGININKDWVNANLGNLINANDSSEESSTTEILNKEPDIIEISVKEIKKKFKINQKIFTDIKIDNYKKSLVKKLSQLNKNMLINKNICKKIAHILNQLYQSNDVLYKEYFADKTILQNSINRVIRSCEINDISTISEINNMIFKPNYDLLFILSKPNLHKIIAISKFSNKKTQKETYLFREASFTDVN